MMNIPQGQFAFEETRSKVGEKVVSIGESIRTLKGDTVENYVPVFESKVKKLHNKIAKELSIPKKNRNKKRLRKMLNEIKGIKKIIKSAKRIETCPHCGKPL